MAATTGRRRVAVTTLSELGVAVSLFNRPSAGSCVCFSRFCERRKTWRRKRQYQYQLRSHFYTFMNICIDLFLMSACPSTKNSFGDVVSHTRNATMKAAAAPPL